jgi:hypothetical protein
MMAGVAKAANSPKTPAHLKPHLQKRLNPAIKPLAKALGGEAPMPLPQAEAISEGFEPAEVQHYTQADQQRGVEVLWLSRLLPTACAVCGDRVATSGGRVA